MGFGYGIVALFLLIGIIFVLFAIVFSGLIRPKRPSKVKLDNYECGEAPVKATSWRALKVLLEKPSPKQDVRDGD